MEGQEFGRGEIGEPGKQMRKWTNEQGMIYLRAGEVAGNLHDQTNVLKRGSTATKRMFLIACEVAAGLDGVCCFRQTLEMYKSE